VIKLHIVLVFLLFQKLKSFI